jgi:hypothetical protein
MTNDVQTAPENGRWSLDRLGAKAPQPLEQYQNLKRFAGYSQLTWGSTWHRWCYMGVKTNQTGIQEGRKPARRHCWRLLLHWSRIDLDSMMSGFSEAQD